MVPSIEPALKRANCWKGNRGSDSVWTSQDLVDSPTSPSSRFKYFGTYSAQMAVASRWIVERFNVIRNVGNCNFPILVDSLFDALFLQTAEERFGDRVIPAISPPAH